MPRRAASLVEYRAKISEDNGMTRAKIPSPLLRDLGAKPGQYVVFRKTDSGMVIEVKKRKKR
jgi:antitoxin component of MazEF toxin-antitoxin module